MLKLSLKILKSFFKQKTGSFILISTGMLVTVLGTILIFSRGAMVFEGEADYSNQTKTVSMEINETLPKDTCNEIHNFLMKNNDLPEIKMILALDDEKEVLGAYAPEIVLGMGIPYGRYFNDEEVQGGRVVLFSDAYLYNADMEFVIEMMDREVYFPDHEEEYTGIGRYNGTIALDMTSSQEVTMPLQTFINNGFSMNHLKAVFEKKLSENQINYLQEYFDRYNVVVAWPEKIESDAWRGFLSETLSNFFVLAICYITLLNLLKYWIEANYRKFYIYYLCGCTSGYIRTLLMLNTFYMHVIPMTLAVTGYKLIERYFVPYGFFATLGVKSILVICLVALIAALMTTWRVAGRQIKKFTSIREVIG